MKVDLLTFEIGSTTTKVRAFDNMDEKPVFLGAGQAPTTVENGDVTQGMDEAREKLEQKLDDSLDPMLCLASSSAAGGLKMTVHGLTEEMTVRAAREASLGAGAVLYHYTVGEIRERDLERIVKISPNIILLAGGVDYGETGRVIGMAEKLSSLHLDCPVVYAGNRALQEEVRDLFERAGKKVYVTENVYPRVDELNMKPARTVIQHVFSEHILHAPGMEKIAGMVQGRIMPVPLSVMKGLELISEKQGDALAIDIGGATTDIHSITSGSQKFSSLQVDPEPESKRTVEGDLGVFVNARTVAEQCGDPLILDDLDHLSPMPGSEQGKKLTEQLTWHCLRIGMDRHTGSLVDYFGPTGKKQVVRGRDLTATRVVVGTGGALTQLGFGERLIRKMLIKEPFKKLLPLDTAAVIIDENYLLGSLGVIMNYNRQWAESLVLSYFT